MATLIGQVVRRWQTSGDLRLPASEEQILAFEERWRVRMPDAFRALLRASDGMEEGCWDEQQIRFWPLEELRPVSDASTDGDLEAFAGYFMFADYMISSHEYAIRMSIGSKNDVVLVGGGAPIEIAASFEEFLALYVESPTRLFPAS
jgi:hypothetical protein